MTLGAYFAAAGEHQQLAWLGGSALGILVDSAVSNGQVLIMQCDTARGSGVPVHVHQREDEIFLLLDGALTVWPVTSDGSSRAAASPSCPEVSRTPTWLPLRPPASSR